MDHRLGRGLLRRWLGRQGRHRVLPGILDCGDLIHQLTVAGHLGVQAFTSMGHRLEIPSDIA